MWRLIGAIALTLLIALCLVFSAPQTTVSAVGLGGYMIGGK